MKRSERTTPDEALPRRRRPAVTGAYGALLGLVSAGVALAVGELVAIATGPETSPVDAVGSGAVDLTPAPLKEFAIREFGTNDKRMLLTGILVILGLLALAAGLLALRRLLLGAGIVAVFGGLGAYAAISRPEAGVTSIAPSLAGMVVAVAAMAWLVGRCRPLRGGVPAPEQAQGRRARAGWAPADRIPAAPDRRSFVLAGATAVAAAALGYAGSRLVAIRYDVAAARARVRIPRPRRAAPPPPAGVHPNVRGLSAYYTPDAGFYRVDTALVLPQVDPDSWKLRIHGLVDKPVELSFDDLLRRPLDEHDMTLSCVSNPVGGPYVGNARWIGASLPTLLREAGIHSGADQLVARSVDGMTISTPIASVLDGREALLAVAMNGQPLPVAHGFPCRMLVPGFYGYSSACKWVVDIEATTYDAYDAYWVKRGYARIGTLKTSSRIDVPRPLATLPAGPTTVAGIAWATHRGIDAVEIRVDGGPWQEAVLAPQDTPDTWRQWTHSWHATTGSHNLQVRATDGTGATQTGARADPYPSGSTGWHNIVVTVT